MTKNRALVVPAVILGLALLVVAVVYFADRPTPALVLPRPRGRLGPPPRQARDRRRAPRRRLPRLRLVPDRAGIDGRARRPALAGRARRRRRGRAAVAVAVALSGRRPRARPRGPRPTSATRG